MRQPELSEPALEALRLLAAGYSLTRLISESQALSWPSQPVERLESRLVPPAEAGDGKGQVVSQAVARALIERQLVKPCKYHQVHEFADLTEYSITARGRALLSRRGSPLE
jgi:hypothetical protein